MRLISDHELGSKSKIRVLGSRVGFKIFIHKKIKKDIFSR